MCCCPPPTLETSSSLPTTTPSTLLDHGLQWPQTSCGWAPHWWRHSTEMCYDTAGRSLVEQLMIMPYGLWQVCNTLLWLWACRWATGLHRFFFSHLWHEGGVLGVMIGYHIGLPYVPENRDSSGLGGLRSHTIKFDQWSSPCFVENYYGNTSTTSSQRASHLAFNIGTKRSSTEPGSQKGRTKTEINDQEKDHNLWTDQ